MRERPRQAVGVFLTLVGFQDVAVQAHHQHTDEAVVAVRVGKVLIYLHDQPTATAFARTWQDLARDAARLPREIHSSLVAPVNGTTEAAVLIDAREGLSMSGHLVRSPGEYAQLHVVMGRTLFDVRDIGAYGSVTAALREAADLGLSTFATGQRLVRSHEAAARQASALFLPSNGMRRQMVSPRETPLAARSQPRSTVRYAQER